MAALGRFGASGAALAFALCAGLAAGSAAARAQTLVRSAPIARDVDALPRVRGLADAAAQARVNAILAASDDTARVQRRACLAAARAADRRRGGTPLGGGWTRTVTVRYQSQRFLSVDAVTGYDCGGAHPDDATEAFTFELTTGRAVDWARALRPGVVPADDADVAMERTVLGRQYLAGYRRLPEHGGLQDECVGELRTLQPFGYTIRLARDARGRPGLAVEPQLPHVMSGCADAVLLGAAEALAVIADPALRAELAR